MTFDDEPQSPGFTNAPERSATTFCARRRRTAVYDAVTMLAKPAKPSTAARPATSGIVRAS